MDVFTFPKIGEIVSHFLYYIQITVISSQEYLHNQGRILLFLHAQCFIYIALLVTLTVGKVRSAYLFLFPVIFHSLTTILNMIVKFKLHIWVYIQLIGQIIPVFYFCSLTVTVFAVFIPMTGRGDASTNPDLMMALFSVLLTLLLVGLSVPLMVLLRKIRYFYILLGAIFLVTVILIITPIGFPFREGTSPQRYYIFVSISWYYLCTVWPKLIVSVYFCNIDFFFK